MNPVTDVRKTIQYAKRNGLREAMHMAGERALEMFRPGYRYVPPAQEVLEIQRTDSARLERGEEPEEVFREEMVCKYAPVISILVPACDPDPGYFQELLLSVLHQTYTRFELIIADAGSRGDVESLAASAGDRRIIYHRLKANDGISANTNAAASLATGDYVAFLDHDDMLTPDALFEMALAIMRSGAEVLYSDEDKCDSRGKKFFEPNLKPDFNPDYLFSNNYICHLLVMRRELFTALKLRSAYDGAQDYDLILRAPKSGICHVRKVLYHWRTHSGSTAGNPNSKNYAYEAGKEALEDYFRSHQMRVNVHHARHRGFYRVEYLPDIFRCRADVGIVGGKLVGRNKRIIGGMMTADGEVLYRGFHQMDSGTMHRADTIQNAVAVDVRCMIIRPELKTLYKEIFGADYEDHIMQDSEELKSVSIEFCRRAAQMGYLTVWDPDMIRISGSR